MIYSDSLDILPMVPSLVINNSKLESKIIDVYKDNFFPEIKRIGKYLKQYCYFGIDTEFPVLYFHVQLIHQIFITILLKQM